MTTPERYRLSPPRPGRPGPTRVIELVGRRLSAPQRLSGELRVGGRWVPIEGVEIEPASGRIVAFLLPDPDGSKRAYALTDGGPDLDQPAASEYRGLYRVTPDGGVEYDPGGAVISGVRLAHDPDHFHPRPAGPPTDRPIAPDVSTG